MPSPVTLKLLQNHALTPGSLTAITEDVGGGEGLRVLLLLVVVVVVVVVQMQLRPHTSNLAPLLKNQFTINP